MELPRLTSRQWLIVLHDLVVTAAAIVATLLVRFDDARLNFYLAGLPKWLPVFVLYAGVVYFVFGLYKAKWRFASLPDLNNIFRASTRAGGDRCWSPTTSCSRRRFTARSTSAR